MNARDYVCAKCVEDRALQALVKEQAVSEQCDYCGRRAKKPIACEVTDVIERIRWAIEQRYNDPNDELPWDEGDYCGTVIHGSEILDEVELCVENAQLLEDIADAFAQDAFCRRDYFGPTGEETFGAAWRRFKEIAQHQRRYTFWTADDEGDFRDPSRGITANMLLRILGDYIEFLSPIEILRTGSEIWRVRVFAMNDGKIKEPEEYTSPPKDKALRANRLSPPGISMFYGASDAETAFWETIEIEKAAKQKVQAARFSACVPLTLLDLTQIPRPDSYFSQIWDHERLSAREFLQAFADTLSQPIAHDEKYHLEYVWPAVENLIQGV